ncbi:MAG: hypothetical protein DSO07_10095 [Thermoproteota archaeon]|jgi:hypothetical protein|uniref:Uncharacterized protein n=1 Tax=Candidatus Methanodesulfokora washburnensis TaxID=2478471 RepID=A0A3R9PZS0_9CREN|nr:hypothetical protein [Candidatus Methanodesulfokores washburnensis]RSN77417.1 hypothetical protein D6D85_02710 [Candidatus Methanodesulfokores washburnensis]TDA39774.1 MAG: hypothetical protein DSO07_10095 [Candidatus Korarchaeota archaeon]
MVDLKEWKNEELKRSHEIVCSLLDRVKRGEKISLLDFTPEYREILRERTYGLWMPPGSIQTMLWRPLGNLANMLDRGMPVPSILLTPLDSWHKSKAEFMAYYGLVPERGGPSYDIFLQEIREGRILPVITGIPTYYKGDFYQEILKACKEGKIQQLPPSLSYRIASFMEEFSLIASAIQERIPPERGWRDLALQRHPEYDIESWLKEARNILSDERVRIIQNEYPFMRDKEDVASAVATHAYELSIFGFSDLANLSLKFFRESPSSFDVLRSYEIYLVFGYSEGLGGLRIYDRFDLEMMTFLRIIKNVRKTYILRRMRKRNLLRISPASSGVIGTATKIPIVMKFDEDDLKNSLKRERNEELEKCMLNSIRTFQEYDFREFYEKNKVINEIITERIAKETREYYRRSKIVEGIIISGGTLTLAAGATAAYQYLQPLLQIINLIIPEIMIEMMKKRKEAARWLVSRWPFQQKGLPFYLWLHGIRADRIKKALNA